MAKIIFFALAALLSFTLADFKDDMEALENDLMTEYQGKGSLIKKSIKDLTTEELITELEGEFHDTEKKSDKIIEQKFRKRFENILSKRESLAKLASADISTLLDSNVKEEDMTASLLKALDESSTEKRDAEDGTCKDERTDCSSLVGYCKSHREKLEKACALTCQYCVKCKQATSPAVCLNLKKRGYCDHSNPTIRRRMVHLCAVTCNFCRQPAAPKCSTTKNGCCWDKSTVKKDATGSNCPECKNTYKTACKTFKDDCDNFRLSGTFMRQNCPKQCGLCDGKCMDVKEKEFQCPFWKKDLKWCELKHDVMKAYCPKTCNLC